VSLSATSVTVSWRTDQAGVEYYREYDRAGDLAQESGFGGVFRTIDHAGRDSTLTFKPPADEAPPYDIIEGYPSSYQESQFSADLYDVSLTIRRLTNRDEPFSSVSETGAFEFATERGTLGLPADAVSQTSREGSTTGAQPSLTLRLTADEAAAAVDAWSHPEGVVERAVHDGEDTLEDDSPNARQTVTLSSPAASELADGDYFVLGWSLEQVGYEDRRYQVDVTLAE